MKRSKEVTIIVVLLVVAVLTCKMAFGANGVQRPKDLRDFLAQPPNSVYQVYGYSEETFLLYNIIAVMEASQKQELRIKALEKQVAELEKKIERRTSNAELSTPNTDPNN